MSGDNKQPPWVVILVAVIGALGAMAVCGVPIVSRLVDIYLPAVTPTPPTGINGGGTGIVSSVECPHPQELARQKGWRDKGWASDPYGGLNVELNKADTLPQKWEALGARRIVESDPDRSMSAGVWTIYTPFACRDKFGFSR